MASLREGYDTLMAEIVILKRAIVNFTSTLSQGEVSCVSTLKLRIEEVRRNSLCQGGRELPLGYGGLFHPC